MPTMGDLESIETKDVKLRLRTIQALLNWKESTSQEIRQGFNEKLRKVTQERDTLERKCLSLEEQMTDMDKQKYQLELRAKEIEENARQMKLSQAVHRFDTQGQLKNQQHKSQIELWKAEKSIERLQDNIEKTNGQ